MMMCTQCVMDTTDPDIQFDHNGVCNHCHTYKKKAKTLLKTKKDFIKLASKIKIYGAGKKYDCLIGLSGGTDSSYVAVLVKQFGLRPLAFHLDNTYNTPESENNILQLVKKLKIDLVRFSPDFDEYTDIQLSFFKAGVIDIEMVTDHLLNAYAYRLCKEHDIKYFIGGGNHTTEAIMPASWNWRKNDLMNLKDIHQTFGTKEIRTCPTLGLRKWLWYEYVKGIKRVHILNYINYNKVEAQRILTKHYGWQDYGGKHYESRFTKFYQAYILPMKFGIDKRRPYLSSLINSGQLSRETALQELKKPLYNDVDLNNDMDFVLKQMKLNATEFNELMQAPIKKHDDYKTDTPYFNLLRSIKRMIH